MKTNTRLQDLKLLLLTCQTFFRLFWHLRKDKKSHICSHLQENPQCQEKVNFDCFEIIDRASSYFRLQIKEAMHIN